MFEFTYRADELVDACKAFLCLDTALHLPFVALLVPNLEAFIELPNKVCSNFVIDNAHESATAILRRVFDVYSWLSRLWVVSHACRRHLVCFKLDGEKFFKFKCFQVVREGLYGLFSWYHFALSIQVLRLRAINCYERIQNSLWKVEEFIRGIFELS